MDDVDTIADYYLTGVGAVGFRSKKLRNITKLLTIRTNVLNLLTIRLRDGRVTKLKVII